MDGEVVLRKKEIPTKPFTKVSTDKTLNNNFINFRIFHLALD